MAIARKPKATTPTKSSVNIDELISRGGESPKGAGQGTDEATVPVILRIPPAMLQQIDAAVKAKAIKTPRHRWLLEAIHEKLLRDAQP
jgi:hypothetical protein